MSAILLIIPDFFLILGGFMLRRWAHLGDHFWTGLEKLVYFVLFPALLFNALARADIDFRAAVPLIGAGAAGVTAGIVLALPARSLFAMTPMSFASQFQCGFRFNTYIGIAVAGSLHGAEGIATMGVLVGTMVPLVNLVSVWMLARHGEVSVWRELASNPLLLATLAGLAFNAADLPYPALAQQLLGRLAEASITLGLLAVGAALKLRGAHGFRLSGGYLIAVKLLAVPAAAWLAVNGLGLVGVWRDVAVLFSALPTATSAYILAVRMRGDGPAVAWIISAGTLAAMLTLPVWLLLLGR